METLPEGQDAAAAAVVPLELTNEEAAVVRRASETMALNEAAKEDGGSAMVQGILRQMVEQLQQEGGSGAAAPDQGGRLGDRIGAALLAAARKADHVAVQELLDDGESGVLRPYLPRGAAGRALVAAVGAPADANNVAAMQATVGLLAQACADKEVEQALLSCAAMNRVDQAQGLLSEYLSEDVLKRTLCSAASRGHDGFVGMLLEAPCGANLSTDAIDTALRFALKRQHTVSARLLVPWASEEGKAHGKRAARKQLQM